MSQSDRIFLSPPDVGPAERDAVLMALESGWVAPVGPALDAFEHDMMGFTGTANAVALSSGTAALHLALLTLGVGLGDEVIVPTLTERDFTVTLGQPARPHGLPGTERRRLRRTG
jgi:dTDP-4-amino-4,6-dideoxygalactose transaminase